jgi:DNA-binding beta-propeller fold protein YncE
VAATKLLTAAALLATATTPARAGVQYHVERSIPAEARYWDYSSIDSERGQLYVGRIGGVLVVDLKTDAITEPLFAGELIHAVIPIKGHLILAADGAADELKVYDVAAQRMAATVKVGGHPDALAFDLRTNTVITVNKQSRDLTLVDASSWRLTGTIKLPGDPEFAVTNDAGTLYVNISDQGRIATVDLGSKRIVGGTRLKGCREASGIAYDKTFDLLISVCGNGVAKFLSAATMREAASLRVGRGADAVLLDAKRHLVFIPAGDDGTLSVIALHSAGDIALVSTVKTEAGAASGAVDPETGRVYLPAGRRLREAVAPGEWHPPNIAKGSFHILVVSPGDPASR